MATDLEAARLMVLRGAWAIDNDHPEKTKWCAMAKRMATDACFISSTDCALSQSAAARSDIDLSIDNDGLLVPLTESMVSTLTLGAATLRESAAIKVRMAGRY